MPRNRKSTERGNWSRPRSISFPLSSLKWFTASLTAKREIGRSSLRMKASPFSTSGLAPWRFAPSHLQLVTKRRLVVPAQGWNAGMMIVSTLVSCFSTRPEARGVHFSCPSCKLCMSPSPRNKDTERTVSNISLHGQCNQWLLSQGRNSQIRLRANYRCSTTPCYVPCSRIPSVIGQLTFARAFAIFGRKVNSPFVRM